MESQLKFLSSKNISKISSLSGEEIYKLIKNLTGAEIYEQQKEQSLSILHKTEDEKQKAEELLKDLKQKIDLLKNKKSKFDLYMKEN